MGRKLLITAVLVSILSSVESNAQKATQQKEHISFGFFEGTLVAGYVDQGAFLNFTGPNVSYTSGKTKVLAGMLPSLRFKEDKATVKNSFVTPTLGIGITYSYQKFAVQVPFYYNTKMATVDGRWNIGVGIGFKLK